MTASLASAGPPKPVPPEVFPARFSIRRQLFWFVATFILATGGLVAILLAYLRTNALESSIRILESFARLAAEQTERTLESADQRLEMAARGLAQLSDGGGLDQASAGAWLRGQTKAIPFARSMWVMDAEGRIIFSSDGSNIGLNLAERDYFQIYRAQPHRAFFLGTPAASRTTGQLTISASRPLRAADGAFSGIVATGLDPGYFDNLWRLVDLGGTSISLWRRDGTLMMRTPFDQSIVGVTFPDIPLLRKMTEQNTGTAEGRDAKGVSRVFAFRTLSLDRELTLLVDESRETVLAPWRRLATLSLFIWATGSVATILLSMFLRRAWQRGILHETQGRQMAERLTLATNATSIAIWDWDVTADRIFASPTYFTMLGYDPEERLSGREEWLDRIHEEDRTAVRESIDAALNGTAPAYRYEARMRHADGSFRWIRAVGSVLGRDQNGKATRLFGSREDITESRRTEEALRLSEHRFRDLVDSTDGIVWEADASTFTFTFVSTNAERLLGYPVAHWLGPGFWASHIHAEDREHAVQFCVTRTSQLEDHDFEYRFIAQDGRPVWLRDIVRVVKEDGKPRWLRGLMVDITASKQSHDALQSSLLEKQALLKEVHHRVKNNLQVITSLLSLETGRNDLPQTKAVLKDMQGRIQSMALLHETLYRSTSFAAVDLGAYLRQLANQSFRALNAKPGLIQLKLDLASAHVKFDQAIPCGLLVNELISNGLKHGFPDGHIGSISVELQAVAFGLLRLSVSDTGVGLPENFESKRGQSLGLQLVSDLARQLGGRLEVGRGPGMGAVFSVTFPGGEPAESRERSGRSAVTIEIPSVPPR